MFAQLRRFAAVKPASSSHFFATKTAAPAVWVLLFSFYSVFFFFLRRMVCEDRRHFVSMIDVKRINAMFAHYFVVCCVWL
jgi:hypothetical protein